MFNVGFGELLIILIIILLLFGAKRLPEIARALGKALNEFKRASREDGPEGSDNLKNKEEKKSNK